ncbi:hypothetical protein RCO48_29460 [Peribacillus frigoritolerans]|nr:hypothetical protein [Peribacillus frigoritolerans]
MIGLVLLMTVSFCYAMFQGGFVSWFIFLFIFAVFCVRFDPAVLSAA